MNRVLKPIHLWGIAVGLVISGEYFGWNYGWGVAGTVGFLIATVAVTAMYVTFIFSFTELTTAIPNAGGPFAYSFYAFGPIGGFVAGYATLVEFLLAPPAIAFALGSYTHFLFPSVPVVSTAVVCFVVFTAINMVGIKGSAAFSLVVTVLAVAELLVYMGVIAPHFALENFVAGAMDFDPGGIFAALPFAIWFYLAIEGVAMVAEETADPQRAIPKGYTLGLTTLVALVFGVMLLTGGIGDWRSLSNIDYPLPEALKMVLGEVSALTHIFASLGLFGLIASFHGIIIGYSRQIFALARSGYLPAVLSRVNSRFKTPNNALLAGGVFGLLAVVTGTTDKLIVLSALGAVVMYMVSMISLFWLRRTKPELQRPFKAPFFPFFPAVAFVLSFICLAAIVYFNSLLSIVFFAVLIVGLAIFVGTGKHRRVRNISDADLTAALGK